MFLLDLFRPRNGRTRIINPHDQEDPFDPADLQLTTILWNRI